MMIKRSVLAASVALAVVQMPAMAQQTQPIQLYGIVDAGLEYMDNGDATAMRVQSGTQSGSRFGIRGTEDLGNGLKALFVLENGFSIDTAVQSQGGRLFGRQAFAGISGGFGQVTLGRQYRPSYNFVAAFDTFAHGLNGTAGGSGAGSITGFEETRADSSVVYRTPTFSGLTLNAMYASGRDSLNSRDDTVGFSGGQLYGLGGDFKMGALAVGAFFQQMARSAAGVSQVNDREWGLGGSYDLGAVKVFAGYTDRNVGGANASNTVVDRDSLWLGAQYTAGAQTIGLQIAQSQMDAYGTVGKGKGTTIGLNYRYALSKRTNAYVSAAFVQNNGNGQIGISNANGTTNVSARGADPMALGVGIRHQF